LAASQNDLGFFIANHAKNNYSGLRVEKLLGLAGWGVGWAYAGDGLGIIKIRNMEEQLFEVGSNKQDEHFYDVLTGSYKYPLVDWQPEELEPDLVLVWNLPTQEYIEKSKFMPMSAFISAPEYYFEKAYARAQKNILSEMSRNKENTAEETIHIRLQKSIVEQEVRVKEGRYCGEDGETYMLEMECVHEKNKVLDGFTLQYNAIVYTLQRVCGFRVRTFLLYNEEMQNKRLFFFLSMSIENRLTTAAKYRIKKEIDYSKVDLYLNDPTGKDGRPLKLHNDHSFNQSLLVFYKRISRFFDTNDPHFG
jgi:hypothetical protein